MLFKKNTEPGFSAKELIAQYADYVEGRIRIHNDNTISMNMRNAKLEQLEAEYPHIVVPGNSERNGYIKKTCRFQDVLEFVRAESSNDQKYICVDFKNVYYRGYELNISRVGIKIGRRSLSFGDLIPGARIMVTGFVEIDDNFLHNGLIIDRDRKALSLSLIDCVFSLVD